MRQEIERFLQHVHPQEGLFCVMSIGGGPIQTHFYNSVSDAIDKTISISNGGTNAYYGCAKFITEKRVATNAKFFKSFWIDIDCERTPDDPKPYKTQVEGAQAMLNFCRDAGLPKPTVVNSGWGLHCYWTLEETITYNEWKPVAEGLRALCTVHKLEIDAGCTGDASRVLRIPGTRNFRDINNPKPVSVDFYGEHSRFEVLKEAIGVVDISAGRRIHELDELTRNLAGLDKNVKNKFKLILDKSLTGKGCEQIAWQVQNQNSVSEPQWYDILSTIAYCEDVDKAAPFVSKQHSSYDPDLMWSKVYQAKGPHNCDIYERNRPGGCDGCIHKGKIKNPLVLGKYIPEAEPEDNIVTVMHSGLKAPVTASVPQYPFPYFRPKHGGVYIKTLNGENTEEGDDGTDDLDKCIYRHDLYVSRRLKDPDLGECAAIVHILPIDGMEEFTVPLQDVMTADKAKRILSSHSVAVPPMKINAIVTYIMKSVEHMQLTNKLEIARSQFGWHDDDECFAVGSRQINALDITFSPQSSATLGAHEHFVKVGTLENWKALANLYGKQHNACRAFVLGLGFGSVFVKYTNVEGFVVHITNAHSGQGKSTSQYMAASIWGNPKTTIKLPKDTVVARQHQMGILQHLPILIDEITNLSPEAISELAFSATSGRAKDRMQGSTNALRVNNSTWRTCMITSGNCSIYDRLNANTEFPEGELMRVIEFTMPEDKSIDKQEADYWYGKVMLENYGVACEPFIQYILNNRSQCLEILKTTQTRLDRRVGFTSKHRYYSVAGACALTGLKVAKLAGCIDFDDSHVEDWLVDEFSKITKIHEASRTTVESQLGSYINTHIRSIVVINANPVNGLQTAPTVVPTNELRMRYEPDTKKLYIDQQHLKAWCSGKRASSRALLDEINRLGGATELTVSLGKGMYGSLPSPPINCLCINYTMDTDAVKGHSELDESQSQLA